MNDKVHIGILTYYYRTHNYGGMLQAYALTKFLLDQDFCVEQICCTRDDERPFDQSQENMCQKMSIVSRWVTSFEYRIIRKWYKKKIVPHFERRNANFCLFEEKIPHSKKVYSMDTIDSANEQYTHFITGSDQIWTFRWFNPIFFLEFVQAGKKKISYAASIGKSRFTVKEKEYLRKVLPQFDAISVREDDLVNELYSITGCDIDLVVDPTLLLGKEEWKDVTGKRMVEGDYLFCYFLGDDPQLRKLAKQLAKRKKIKLVTIPFANESYNKIDYFFGDEQKYDAGPEEFLALIKDAKYVLTDSFHATVFSIIFEKNFITFLRRNASKMSSRLYSLTTLYNCKECFIDKLEDMKIDNILKVLGSKSGFAKENGDALRKKSVEYLMQNLNQK